MTEASKCIQLQLFQENVPQNYLLTRGYFIPQTRKNLKISFSKSYLENDLHDGEIENQQERTGRVTVSVTLVLSVRILEIWHHSFSSIYHFH